eukprot:COSAG01_NODE_11168_length_1991_cov_1.832452_2_plen_406_part_00
MARGNIFGLGSVVVSSTDALRCVRPFCTPSPAVTHTGLPCWVWGVSDPSIGKPGNARAAQWWQWAVNNMTEPGNRPPPPPVPCYLLKTRATCANATWPPDPKTGHIWGRCEWDTNRCADRRPPPPPPPAPPAPPPPAPPPAPGPPMPSWCTSFPGQTASGKLIAKECAGLRLFDCCMRIPQHRNCTAAVAHNGCCDFMADGSGGIARTPKVGSTVIVHNVSDGASAASAEAEAVADAGAGAGLKAASPPFRLLSSLPSPTQPRSWTVQRLVSPSMAQGAQVNTTASCIGADPAKMHFCHGWLQVFKNYTLGLNCTDFQGRATNCWDVIDAIQIHAYARTAAEVLDKIRLYRQVFADDFEGTNGRTKKTLWLTEVAAGSSDGAFVKQFVQDLLSPSTGLNNRAEFE